MKGFLTIRDINALQDWQKTGYFNYYQSGMKACNSLKLLPFISPNVPKSGAAITVTTLSFRRITISGKTKTIQKTESLSTSLLTIIGGTSYDYVYYKALAEQAEFKVGMYEFYIKVNNGSGDHEFISEPFCYLPPLNTYSVDGDFNNDFNEDFYISETGGTGVAFKGLVLTCSDLQNIYPDSFNDVMYFPLSMNRVKREGFMTTEFLTKDTHSTKSEPNFERQRRIQSILYDRYELTIIAKESHNLQLLEFAENVIIQDIGNLKTYHIKVIAGTLSETRLAGTDVKKVSFMFYDTNGANYIDGGQPVSDPLKHSILESNIAGLSFISLYTASHVTDEFDSESKIFYTKLIPKLLSSDIEYKNALLAIGKIDISGSLNYKIVRFIIFASRENAMFLKNYTNRTSPVTSSTTGEFYTTGQIDATIYRAVSSCVIVVEQVDGAVDLYQVTIDIPYEIINHEHY